MSRGTEEGRGKKWESREKGLWAEGEVRKKEVQIRMIRAEHRAIAQEKTRGPRRKRVPAVDKEDARGDGQLVGRKATRSRPRKPNGKKENAAVGREIKKRRKDSRGTYLGYLKKKKKKLSNRRKQRRTNFN